MEKRRFSAKLSEELTLCLGGGRRPTLDYSLTPWRQTDTHVTGLDSRAFLQEEISKGHGVCDPECGLLVLVELSNPLLQRLRETQ